LGTWISHLRIAEKLLQEIPALNYIRDFYSKPDPQRELKRAYPYLNEATMSRFVDDSTQAILKIYSERDRLDTIEADTALVSLTEEEISPYELPIGD
jgi:hypothetical protein